MGAGRILGEHRIRRASRRVVPRAVDRDDRTPSKGCSRMIRRLIWSLVFALLAGLVVKSLPDVARYLKIREM